MEVRWVRTSRIPRWPMWAVALMVLWLVLQGVTAYLSVRAGRHVVTCPLKRLTGVPCPTCGATRGAMRLARGEVFGALSCNPLLFAVLSILVILLSIRLISARTLRLAMTRAERRVAWAVCTILLLANWAYVIRFVG